MTASSGDVCLTTNLATDSEIDFAMNGLISDMERERKLAKDRIKADNEEVMQAVSKRSNTQ